MRYQVFNNQSSTNPAITAPWKWLASWYINFVAINWDSGKLVDSQTGAVLMEWARAKVRLQLPEGEPSVQISERAIAHHLRYLGTTGFKNLDGSSRLPTEQEVVDLGWEPESYLTSSIPTEPRICISGLGKTKQQDKRTDLSPKT
jgi:hypothetical protein